MTDRFRPTEATPAAPAPDTSTLGARGLPVPATRLGRIARLGGVASGIAGAAALNGARQLARGQRPALPALLLTPTNITRLTDELARMRGAAMKLGQLISMDTGEVLPPEIATIMARLRAEAHPMPPKQLRRVLDAAWGPGWLARFAGFQTTPIAAASIGQVHRARTRDGRDLAIKVQYPGVRRSIDSDVDNVATLIRLSGLLPRGLDLAPLMAEAKRQLRDEADYAQEGAHLARFGTLLEGNEGLHVPRLHADLTTPDVLAMDHAPGVPVESLTDAPQETRDSVVARLVALLLAELFDFRLMQTDPNFANYRYDPGTDRVVLLDFGATRALPAELAEGYRALLAAGLDGAPGAIETAARRLGLIGPELPAAHLAALMRMAEIAFAPMRFPAPVDVAALDLSRRLRGIGAELGTDLFAPGALSHVPPMDTLFVQRKLGGIYLLAHRLRARIDMAPLLARHLP